MCFITTKQSPVIAVGKLHTKQLKAHCGTFLVCVTRDSKMWSFRLIFLECAIKINMTLEAEEFYCPENVCLTEMCLLRYI